MLQRKFCNENCMHFEASEENKLIYMDIFKKYQENIEVFMRQRLEEEIEGFDFEQFLK